MTVHVTTASLLFLLLDVLENPPLGARAILEFPLSEDVADIDEGRAAPSVSFSNTSSPLDASSEPEKSSSTYLCCRFFLRFFGILLSESNDTVRGLPLKKVSIYVSNMKHKTVTRVIRVVVISHPFLLVPFYSYPKIWTFKVKFPIDGSNPRKKLPQD